MYETCLNKQNMIREKFAACSNEEERYQKIIELGREQPSLSENEKIEANLVKGCQSQMYLVSHLEENQVIFQAESDALISAGLAALLVKVYSGEAPETVLKCPPTYLEELGISASLSPSRANGLYSLHLRMKQDALKLLMEKK
ncbi:MAG: SufE family protein [Candidatus Protochlamydia sp.]|nr:SufE family protein [Candidatus Protochlamydia sp.]